MILKVTASVVLLLVTTEARRFVTDSNELEIWEEFKDFVEWKKWKDYENNKPRYRSGQFDPLRKYDRRGSDDSYAEIDGEYGNTRIEYGDRNVQKKKQDPPPPNQPARMCRYIVNQADWTSAATISTRQDIKSFPTVNVIAITDGEVGNGTGLPYLYLTPFDFTPQDLAKDNRATLLMTLAQGEYCREKKLDAMDPRCARVMLTGRILAVDNTTAEFGSAMKALVRRHPWLGYMPADHLAYPAKLKLMAVALLDSFGGAKFITVDDYLHPPTSNSADMFYRRFPTKRQYYDVHIAENYV